MEPSVRELRHLTPDRAIFLTALFERAPPDIDDMLNMVTAAAFTQASRNRGIVAAVTTLFAFSAQSLPSFSGRHRCKVSIMSNDYDRMSVGDDKPVLLLRELPYLLTARFPEPLHFRKLVKLRPPNRHYSLIAQTQLIVQRVDNLFHANHLMLRRFLAKIASI